MTVLVDMDLDAVEADARAKLEQLAGRSERLAPEALAGDPEVLGELELVESERRAAELAIERAATARRELGRRDVERQKAQQLEARQAAEERARAIDIERLKAVASVDAGLRKAAHAVADLLRLTRDLDVELRAAGRARARAPQGRLLRAAVHAAFSEAGVSAAHVLGLEREQPRPLSEALPSARLDGPAPADDGAHTKAEREARARAAAHAAAVAKRESHFSKRRVEVATSPAQSWRMHRQAGLSPQQAADQVAHEYQRPLGGIGGDEWLRAQIEAGEREYLESINKEQN